ncbi:glycoside hydrolase family 19 protein [Paraburkholderia sp. ZP32-5]|uniref:glycoside hydrolase family 19 protein n=1 Tax=Paraburkholderia sp. ZP32-5 TaxID=2883245 RepID=UPI001F357D35|nr:chitinase [Paraburkholderia sp. ZP32-5]
MANTTPPNPPSTPVKLLSFAFPFRKKGQTNGGAATDFTDEHEIYQLLKQESSGAFPVSSGGMWHGGIHITEAGAGQSMDIQGGIRCIADGEVVAWRLNRAYPVSEIPAHDGQSAVQAPYSTGFALVKHTMEFPPGTKLTFFSLYMHLQDYAGYESDPTLPWPAYWAAKVEVTQDTIDKPNPGANGQPVPGGQTGLNVHVSKPNGAVLGILPQGTQVSLSRREGNWGQIADDPGALYPPTIGTYVPSSVAKDRWIFLGKEIGREGPVVKNVVPDSSFDCVNVVPEEKRVKVKAGDVVGFLGRYDSLRDSTSTRMVHIEVFCDDSIKQFIAAGRAWVNSNVGNASQWSQLGLSSQPTILRVGTGVQLYQAPPPGQPGQDQKQTDVIQVYQLASLPRDSNHMVAETATGNDGQKRNWWKVDSADIQRNPISGWVREQSFAGGMVASEHAQSWVDFVCHDEDHDPTHTIFAASQDYVDYKTDKQTPNPGSKDKLSPLMAAIYSELFPTGDGAHAADELADIGQGPQGSGFPWVAFRASRLIPKHESEWANPAKWQELVSAIEQHTGPKPEHEEEKKRIANLVWWDEVQAGVQGFPGSDVFHIHPVGLVGNFCQGGFRFTLPMMQHMFPNANSVILQQVIDELNPHLDLFRLDSLVRRNHFFAQVKQEVGPSLAIDDESLNYSATALATGGIYTYFTSHPADAQTYGRTNQHPANQEAIANHAYAGQDGNGGILTGDGYRYRGRGMIQLTHRGGYRRFTLWHRQNGENWIADENINFEETPDIVGQVKFAVRSACYFWVVNRLYNVADAGSALTVVDNVTRVVNPGLFHGAPSSQKTASITGRRTNFSEIDNWGGLQ